MYGTSDENNMGDMYSFPSTSYSSAVVHLNDTNPSTDFPQRPIDPYNPAHPHPLIQRNTSSKIDKVEQVERARRLSSHLLICFLEIDSGSAQRKGEPGAVVGERDVGVGVVTMLRTFGASVIWSLKS